MPLTYKTIRVNLRHLENLAYGIMEGLSRRTSEVYVFLTHDIQDFEMYRHSEISKAMIKSKSYRSVGSYTSPPNLDIILKRIKSVCENNHIIIDE